ncbi:hypothetical protein [Lentilactobacillus sp. Marseille-Q4993]|uniref:hypothetical protein n=1 Tax=Lentilactobacillus sp. Marseille-Q4993 TaxID=3039492 RepID=UPI0024BC8A45|nr:hypothetical protein [Lentilactobacillus sp. Marseille-Q4993]
MLTTRIITRIICGLALGIGFYTTTDSASAKTKPAQLVKVKTFSPATKVKATKGPMYTNYKLTKKNHNLAKYKKTVFTTGKTVTVKLASGKHAIYKYLRSQNGKVKGYVASKYVKKADTIKRVKSTKSSKSSLSHFSLTEYRNEFIKALNAERAKRKLPPPNPRR